MLAHKVLATMVKWTCAGRLTKRAATPIGLHDACMAHGGGLLFDPALHAAYYQYQWATDRRNAVTVCVRDVQRLGYAFPSLFEQGVLRVFLHHQWPCIYVTLVATIVAVREQEAAMEYTGMFPC